VIATVACPSISEATFGCTPSLRSRVAAVCLRSWLCRRRHNHDLRHTAATLLLGGGVHPKIAAEMLGHTTVAITLNRYSHVTETMQREAAQVMGAIISPAGDPDGKGSG